MKTEAGVVRLSLGLQEGVAHNLEGLLKLWDEMLVVSVEAAQTPELDPNLFAFAENCFFFAVITVKQPVTHQALGPSCAGFVYCITSPHGSGPAGEVNIGIILQPQFRGKGYARQAIELTLKWVFEDAHFHRVQAAVMDTLEKDKALALFTQL
jgi:GNAT superfamily N-acetyltransferase